MQLNNNGSSTELSTLAPKIILSPLLKAMVGTLKNHQSDHFFNYYGPSHNLHFDATAFVSAVFKQIGTKNDSKPIYNIIKDIQLLPEDSKLRISTLFDKESEAKTAQTYRDLDQVMSEIVQQVLQNAPTGMALNFLNQFLGDLKYSDPVIAKNSQYPMQVKGQSKVASLQYTNDLKAKDGELRLFTVTEEISKPQWVKEVCEAIKAIVKQSYSASEKMPLEVAERMQEILDDECSAENNDIQNLLHFVEIKALSRARIRNCFKIMEIIADHIEKTERNDFKRESAVSYIRKAIAFFEIFGNRIAPWNEETTESIKDYSIDFSAIYGAVGKVDFNGLMAYVGATDALPIWVKPKIEMNDIRHEDKDGLSLKREVTYAFRVNGEFVKEEKVSSFNSKLQINYKTSKGNRSGTDTMLTAYEARLHTINKALLLKDIVDDKGQPISEERLSKECSDRVAQVEMFQLIMMYFVLSGADMKISDFEGAFNKLVDAFKNPQKIRLNLTRILDEKLNTEKMHERMEAITSTITTALKANLDSIISEMEKDSSLKTVLYILPSIVNLDVFKSSIGEDAEQFFSIFKGKESNFYSYISMVDASRKKLAKMSQDEIIRKNDYARKALSEIEFNSTLKIRTLVPIENPNTDLDQFDVARNLNIPCLPVLMVPTNKKVSDNGLPHFYHPESLSYDNLLSKYKVMIHYSSKLFRLSDLKGGHAQLCLDEKENALIISTSCFSIAIHLFLKHLVKEVKNQLGIEERLYVPVMRIDSVDEHENEEKAQFQRKSKKIQKGGFNPECKRAYATAYTLEKLLNNDDAIVKVQGLKYQPDPMPYDNQNGERVCAPVNLAMDKTVTYRIQAAIEALSGYSEIIIPFEGTKDKIACISYNSRPENDVEFKYQHQKDLLLLKPDYGYICYVYTLERINDKQGRLSLQKVSHAPVAEDNLRTSKAMHRIIEKLQSDGFEDVVLLSHHFAQRKIGKTETSNLIHESESALDQLDQLFPDMNFYPFQSDTIPALSLKTSDNSRAYEVPHHHYHTAIINQKEYKQSLSVYSFATKRTVGVRTQNGICSYFYMLTSQEHSIHNDKRIRLHSKIIDVNDSNEMKSIRSVLRGLHYFESERPTAGKNFTPVLEPSHIRGTTGIQELGEVIVSSRLNKGEVVMSLPALIGKLEEYVILKNEDLIDPIEPTPEEAEETLATDVE